MIATFYKHKYLFLFTSLLICFVPYIWNSFYANPVADDFCYAFLGRGKNPIQASLDEYNRWNGRYIANILVFTNPIEYTNFLGYKLAPILIIGLTIASFYFFIATVTHPVLTKKQLFVIALTLSLLFIYQMPSISEGIYWYSGAVIYQLGNLCLLVYTGFYILLFQKRYILKNKWVHVSVLTFFLFVSTGFNEVLMAISLLFTLTVCFIVVRNKLGEQRIAIFLLAASLAFSAILYFAPGNSARSSHFTDRHQFVHSVFMSVLQTIRFFTKWAVSPPLLLLSVLYCLLNKKLCTYDNLFSRSFYLTPFTSLLLIVGVIFTGAFLPYWATGILGQHRTMNISCFLFLLLWFVNLTVFLNRYSIEMKPLSEKKELLILSIIWLAFLFLKNGYESMNDIYSGKSYTYNQLMVERYSIIKNGGDTVYFKPITNPPKTLFVNDITPDYNHWLNKAYDLYFNVDKKVMLEK